MLVNINKIVLIIVKIIIVVDKFILGLMKNCMLDRFVISLNKNKFNKVI